MNIRKRLSQLVEAIAEEAEHNPSFALRIEHALGTGGPVPSGIRDRRRPEQGQRGRHGRRSAAVLDPITVYREGEETLRDRLRQLSQEQLRDIVAEYGMDPDKLAMKWKSSDRLIDRIVEVSRGRATKGDAFRS